MKTFMAIFIGSSDELARRKWNDMEPRQRAEREQAGVKAWGDWMTRHDAAIVTPGAPLGKTKRTSATGVVDVKNDMTAYVVIRAETHEAAAKMFEGHPHFTIFPGEAIEIMECLPIPGQP